MNLKTKSIAAFLVLAVLLCAACGAAEVVTGLELAIDAAEAVLPAIATAANVPPATVTLIDNYLAAVATALSQTSALLASSSASGTAVEAGQITALFAQALVPVLPAGTPQAVAAAVQAVGKAVANFVAQFTATTTPAGGTAFAAAKRLGSVKLTKAQRAKVVALKARADAVLAKLPKR
jgi:hypothetical protein